MSEQITFKRLKTYTILMGEDGYPVGIFNSDKEAEQYNNHIGMNRDVYVIPKANLFRAMKKPKKVTSFRTCPECGKVGPKRYNGNGRYMCLVCKCNYNFP